MGLSCTILGKLYEVKAAIDEWIKAVPEISLLRRINQAYAEAHLFGQYMSGIFKANLGI